MGLPKPSLFNLFTHDNRPVIYADDPVNVTVQDQLLLANRVVVNAQTIGRLHEEVALAVTRKLPDAAERLATTDATHFAATVTLVGKVPSGVSLDMTELTTHILQQAGASGLTGTVECRGTTMASKLPAQVVAVLEEEPEEPHAWANFIHI